MNAHTNAQNLRNNYNLQYISKHFNESDINFIHRQFNIVREQQIQ